MDMNEEKTIISEPIVGYTDQDIQDFGERVRDSLGRDFPSEYTVEPKINGISVELVYKKGALTVAVTRDQGCGGEYITANLKTLLTVPLTLFQLDEDCSIPELLAVRGLVYMEFEAFRTLNLRRIEKVLPPFAGPADAAVDSLRQPNPRITAKRMLNMFCSGIVEYEGLPFETEMESMIMLQKWGLRVNKPHLRLCKTIEKVIPYCRHLEEIRSQFPYQVDGALIKINRPGPKKKLIERVNRSDYAIVFKFK